MNRIIGSSIFLIFAFVFSVPLITPAKEPENLHTLKQAVVFYHDSGEYDYDQEVVAQRARDYLEARVAQHNQSEKEEKIAVVFDIDETSLSNYKHLLQLNFGMIPQLFLETIRESDDPAIRATLQLYEYAVKQGISIFFITGRAEKLRSVTEKNLKSVGYTEWNILFMKPNDYDKSSVIPYKSSTRKKITEMGYTIVLNIGDQFSDLAGGYAERVFKLPNPYYFIP